MAGKEILLKYLTDLHSVHQAIKIIFDTFWDPLEVSVWNKELIKKWVDSLIQWSMENPYGNIVAENDMTNIIVSSKAIPDLDY